MSEKENVQTEVLEKGVVTVEEKEMPKAEIVESKKTKIMKIAKRAGLVIAGVVGTVVVYGLGKKAGRNSVVCETEDYTVENVDDNIV